MMIEKNREDLINQIFLLMMKRFPPPRPDLESCKGLKQSECVLLVMLSLNLADNPDSMTVTAISELLNITPAGVTHLINPLEELGCLERLRDANDRRIVLISLTEKGRKMAESFMNELRAKLTGLVDHLGEEDTRTLIRLMGLTFDYFSL